MSDIINLRSARKAKNRQKSEVRAEQNRLLHGQTKAAKKLQKASETLANKKLEAHKRESDSGDHSPTEDD